MKCRAIERITYAGRTYQPGEEFDAEDIHAKLLIHHGKLKMSNVFDQKLQTATVKAETPPDKITHAETPPNRRTYKRRDMRPED